MYSGSFRISKSERNQITEQSHRDRMPLATRMILCTTERAGRISKQIRIRWKKSKRTAREISLPLASRFEQNYIYSGSVRISKSELDK